MITRGMTGISKPKHQANLAFLDNHKICFALFAATEPKGFKSATKNPKWMQAMHDEMIDLQQNGTWILVPRPSDTNVVGSKWVFHTKYHSDGSVERFKARLVAQGFTQWKLYQLDVKNAFLHGHLNETVYMEQPLGFSDPGYPNHVCQLKKAIYGLKQASRAWFQFLNMFLTTNGFTYSTKHALDILQRASLLDSKPVATPLVPLETFSNDGKPFHDPTFYRSLVGVLQYLTITQPDLSYVVNHVSPFLHALTESHFQYADWARFLETRCLTYGYLIFLGGNLVSWSAKKQPTVSRSGCESEYWAMANTAAEIV
ncbi:retrovirus-related pol polyprotein from transposon RE1 [Tanacetum coccineum]